MYFDLQGKFVALTPYLIWTDDCYMFRYRKQVNRIDYNKVRNSRYKFWVSDFCQFYDMHVWVWINNIQCIFFNQSKLGLSFSV